VRGAELFVSGPKPRALEELRLRVAFQEVDPDQVFSIECDVFAPCAVGGVIDSVRARDLGARVVAGSANNVLASKEAGEVLFSRGIAYAPDYLVNAGALIQGVRFLRSGERSSPGALEAIGEKTGDLLERSRKAGVPPEALLENETLDRLGASRGWRGWFVPGRTTESA
jgi:leucine dehydrogenase